MTSRPRPPGPGKHLVGLAGTTITGLTGIWLMTAPFALRYQPDGAGWADATQAGFFTGLGVLLVSLTGWGLLAADLVGALRAAGVLAGRRPRPGSHPAGEETVAPAGRAATDVDLEQVLIPLAASLLQELQQPERRSLAQPGQPERPSPHREPSDAG